jgi:hypothetical protein
MIFERGNKVVIKRGDKFIEASIVKMAKPYHGKSYYSKDEIRYFCQIKNGPHSYEVMTQVYSEFDLVNWYKQSSRKDKLKELGI